MSLNYLIPFLAYVAVASPAAYKAVRQVLGSWVASADGLPSIAGLLLHALVYILIVGFLMRTVSTYKTSYYKQKMY